MTTDGGLRQLYLKHLPMFHVQQVETWSTGQGVPDCNVCCDGVESWIENKQCQGGKFQYGAEQVGWVERRRRAGGRVFIAIRVQTTAGLRKGPARDEFWLYPGDAFRELVKLGLPSRAGPWTMLQRPLICCDGGPSKWDWRRIRDLLVDFDFLSFSKGAIESGHIKGDQP